MNDATRIIRQRNTDATFPDWWAQYAKSNIATFPVSEQKRPLIRHYNRIGLSVGQLLASRFADAPAIGFMAGPRNRITALDIDEPGDKPLQRAIDRHGPSPIIVRTASGKHHIWYCYNGERRSIRPEPDIDILGHGGMIIAPPSKGARGHYQFITGDLDQLDQLPIMRDVPSRAIPRSIVTRSTITKPIPAVISANRNNTLWRYCMRTAQRCANLNELLDAARERNTQFEYSLREDELMKVVTSAWEYEQRGENRFGQFGCWFPIEEVVDLTRHAPDAFILLGYLRAHQGPWADFMIANGLSQTFGWGKNRLATARQQLINGGYVVEARPAQRRSPAIYQWP